MGIEQIEHEAGKITEKQDILDQILTDAESDINDEFSEFNGISLKVGGTTTVTAYDTGSFTLTVNVDGVTTHTVYVKPYADGRYYYQVLIAKTSPDSISYNQSITAANATALMLKLRMQDFIVAP